MAAFGCECPACNKPLQFNASAQGEVRINCPQCGHAFIVSVANPTATAPGPQLDNEFFASLPPAGPPARGGGAAHSRGSTRVPTRMAPEARITPPVRRSSGGHSKGWIWIVMGGVGMTVALGLVVGVFALARKGKLPGKGLIDSVRMSMDSPQSVIADLEQVSKRVEAMGRSIPKGDESPESAQPLIDATQEFDALILRACRLQPQPVGVEESMHHFSRTHAENRKDAAERFQANDFFWHAKMNAAPDEAVTKAITNLTLLRAVVFAVVSSGIAELPSPFEYDGTEFDWSDEDRRLLAVIHLRGLMKRDFARELASIDPAAPTTKSLSQLHAVIDRYADLARQLGERNTKSKMFVQVPRATPYQRQENSASMGLAGVKKWCDSQGGNDPQLSFILGEQKQLDEAIENLMFGSGSKGFLASDITSAQRYEELQDQRANEEAKRIAAEKREAAERKRADERRLADAERQRREAEAERQRITEQTQPDSGSIASDGAVNDGRLGPPGGSAFRGGRFGPMGPRGPMGPGGRRTGEPGFSGRGNPRRGPGSFGPPPPPPPTPPRDSNPAKQVTIQADRVTRLDTKAMSQRMPDWLRKYPVTISRSNNTLRITIGDFDRPLEDLEPCFPGLIFEEIQAGRRTIIARERP